jgi:hypothetical protein
MPEHNSLMPREAIDRLYEPLTDDEKRELLRAIRHYSVPGFNAAMSSAANKIEAQLHLSNTGHRIYEGP